jgi:hypothetical protein
MSATLVTPKTTSGGEIITHLINATDGEGLHFDGAAGYIDIPTVPDLGTKFSFEFIIQADSYALTGNTRIIDFGNGGRFIFGWDSSASNNLQIYSVAGWNSLGVKVLDDLKVHHLVVTIDGTAAVIYDNGNQVGTATITSPNIDSCSDARIGSEYNSADNFFDGTLYRTRFWNKTLSQAEVTASYENATVPFADQYGSQTSLVDAAASVFTSGTYSWVAYGTNSIANVSNTLAITYGNRADGAYVFLRNSTDLTKDIVAGKKYRLTVDAKYAGGSAGSGLQVYDGSAYVEITDALTTSLVTYSLEFTANAGGASANVFFDCKGMATSNVVTIDNWYVREIGCVADYDLAFANPTQSLMVQDRAGAADGTSSATGVVQVTPIEQLNSKSARIGTSAATPADGDVVATGQFKTAGGALATPSFAITNEAGLGISRPTANALNFVTASTERMRIDAAGKVGISATPSAWKATWPALDIGQSGSLYSQDNNTTGLASNLYFNGVSWFHKNTGATALYQQSEGAHYFYGNASASAGATFSPTSRLTIDSAGNTTVQTDQNAGTILKVKNATNDTAADAQLRCESSNSLGLITAMPSSYSTSNAYVADSFLVLAASTCSAGLGLAAEGANPINLWTNNTKRLTIGVSGNLLANSGAQLSWGTDGVTAIEGSTVSNRIRFFTNSVAQAEITSSGGVVELGGVLKENLLTNSGFDVWSNSTLENVATIEEDDCASDDTGDWTLVRAALAFDTDHYEYSTTGGSNEVMLSSVSVTAGKLYKISVNVKNGAGSTTTLQLKLFDGTAILSPTITTTGSFVTHTFVVEAANTVTNGYVGLSDVTAFANDIEFKDFIFTEVTPGCVDLNVLAPDGWSKSSTTDLTRISHNTTNVVGMYGCKMLLGGTGGEEIIYPASADRGEQSWYNKFRGRTVTFGCWVYPDSAAGTGVRLYIRSNDAYTWPTMTAPADTLTWLEVTATVPTTAWTSSTHFQIGVQYSTGIAAKTCYVSQPMLVFGSAIGSGNYSRPSGEVVWCEKEISSNTFNGGFSDVAATTLNVESDSNGKIPKGAKAVYMQGWGQDSGSAGTDCYFHTRQSATSGWMGSLSPAGLANDAYARVQMVQPCNSDGDFDYIIEATGSGTFETAIGYRGVQLR